MQFYKKIILFTALIQASSLALLHSQDLFVEPRPGEGSENQQASAASSGVTDTQRVQEVIENQLATIRTFDTSKAYYAYTTREFQKNIPLDTFKQFVKKYSVLFRNKSAVQDNVSFQGNVAHYTGKLVSIDGDVYNVTIILISEDDGWKSNRFRLVSRNSRPLRELG